ncbi:MULTISPECIES: thioredoxin [Sanguibacteroides]|uniref:Thioredoxin n=1 Tax=Sanguibacteroides justesenii TaxID=1547597 RepID=A0A0C3RD34_9PORP|nr:MULTISPECIES: thioredoxin [Sanguibacteroides]KIO44071.1 thioredoxin [Sanguibacteroides justesenii]KIO47270.1 thioredoxin [Sanguibacteroides justesenii]PXZ43894.1 thioredoxin [Sanguibacteroides justesenii]
MEKFNELIQGDKLVLVDFYATWCGPCKMMHPVLEDLKKRLGDKITIVKVDVDVPANRQPVYTYHIQSVPTLMLFKQGRVLWNNSGVVPANQLQQIIEKYL